MKLLILKSRANTTLSPLYKSEKQTDKVQGLTFNCKVKKSYGVVQKKKEFGIVFFRESSRVAQKKRIITLIDKTNLLLMSFYYSRVNKLNKQHLAVSSKAIHILRFHVPGLLIRAVTPCGLSSYVSLFTTLS